MEITDAGREVLVGSKNWFDMYDLDHWIGGVHLTLDSMWYWDGNRIL